MAVVEVQERWQERTASLADSGRSYSRSWWVLSDDPNDHPRIAATAPGVPTVGDPFPGDSAAVVTGIETQLIATDSDRLNYIVTVNYATPGEDEGSGGGGGGGGNPLDDGPDWRWSTREITAAVTTAFGVGVTDGGFVPALGTSPPDASTKTGPGGLAFRDVGILNSAGEPFDPTPEQEFSVLIFEYSENVANFNPNFWATFIDTINDDVFSIQGLQIGKYQARAKISADSRQRNGVDFIRQTTSVEIVDDWRLYMADVGLRHTGDVTYTSDYPDPADLQRAVDAQGQPMDMPVALDGDGTIAANGRAATLIFQTQRTRAYQLLGLPA